MCLALIVIYRKCFLATGKQNAIWEKNHLLQFPADQDDFLWTYLC